MTDLLTTDPGRAPRAPRPEGRMREGAGMNGNWERAGGGGKGGRWGWGGDGGWGWVMGVETRLREVLGGGGIFCGALAS